GHRGPEGPADDQVPRVVEDDGGRPGVPEPPAPQPRSGARAHAIAALVLQRRAYLVPRNDLPLAGAVAEAIGPARLLAAVTQTDAQCVWRTRVTRPDGPGRAAFAAEGDLQRAVKRERRAVDGRPYVAVRLVLIARVRRLGRGLRGARARGRHEHPA